MSKNHIKSAVVWGISKGLNLPQIPIDRINELCFLRDLLLDLKIDLVLDVGANRGQFATELRGIGYQKSIVSFEPVVSEYLALKESFVGDRHWRGYQYALGSQEKAMSITVPRLTVLSSLLESKFPEEGSIQQTVQVKRLDGILPDLIKDLQASQVFLKMDTQGYDLEVFRGASGCIGKIRGIQSELSVQPLYKNMSHYLEVLSVYESSGFTLHNLSPVNRVGNGGLVELNCFMKRSVS